MREYVTDILKEKREKAEKWENYRFNEEKVLSEIYRYFSLYELGLIRNIDVMNKLTELAEEDQIK